MERGSESNNTSWRLVNIVVLHSLDDADRLNSIQMVCSSSLFAIDSSGHHIIVLWKVWLLEIIICLNHTKVIEIYERTSKSYSTCIFMDFWKKLSSIDSGPFVVLCFSLRLFVAYFEISLSWLIAAIISLCISTTYSSFNLFRYQTYFNLSILFLSDFCGQIVFKF